MLEKRETKFGRTEKIQKRLERQLEQRESKLPSFDKQVQELQEAKERVEQRLMATFTAAVRTEAKSFEIEKTDLLTKLDDLEVNFEHEQRKQKKQVRHLFTFRN